MVSPGLPARSAHAFRNAASLHHRCPDFCTPWYAARNFALPSAVSVNRLRLTVAGVRSKRVAGAASRLEVRKPKEQALDALLREYLPILILLALTIALGLVLILAAVVLAVRNPDPEKVSAYECGFNAFDDARMKFDVRFYLVSILFIIFDLEVAFLFPWAVAFADLSMTAFWSMMVFLGVLTVGFAYEWKKGALEWE